MKVQIRRNVFETNSSSVHSICIAKSPVSDTTGKKINFYLDEFGWEFAEANRANYLYTAIMVNSKSDLYLNKLKSILDKNGIEYNFEPPKYRKTSYGTYIENACIDHSFELEEFLETILNNEDMLLRYLFNRNSAVYTGNDNSDGFWRYQTAYQGFKQGYDDDGYFINNPYHNEDKFDYFVKGN